MTTNLFPASSARARARFRCGHASEPSPAARGFFAAVRQRFPFVPPGVRLWLLLACLACGPASSAFAQQVYSVNVVGYVRQTLAASGASNLVANPLTGTNNLPNTILPLADEWAGTALVQWDASAQAYRAANAFIGSGLGWDQNDYSWSLNPGRGVWIAPQHVNGPGRNLAVTWVGEVMQGTLSVPILGGGRISHVSSMVPRALPLGQSGDFSTLQFPALDGDVVRVWNPATRTWKEPYTYWDEFGWYSENSDDPGPTGPVIQVGQAFEVLSFGFDRLWTQHGNVYPPPWAPAPDMGFPVPARLYVTKLADGLQISWEGGSSWALEQAADITGPWTAMPASLTSPYIIPEAALTGRGFFRLRLDGEPSCLTLFCPTDQIVPCTDPSGTPVSFNPTVFDFCDPTAQAVCVPPSGALFPVGTNAVTCVASDTLGNTQQCTFRVVVTPCAEPPRIVTQPQSQSILAGTSLTFSVAAAGTEPLGYQWRKDGAILVNGGRISGVSATNLTLTNVGPTDAGAYDVVVTNAYGATNSQVAALTVIPCDTDHDGMPDDWENTYGFNRLDPGDAMQDLDGDALSNRQEYVAGTDPGNAASCLRVNSLVITANGNLSLGFVASSNRSYTLLGTTDFVSWFKLADVPTNSATRQMDIHEPGISLHSLLSRGDADERPARRGTSLFGEHRRLRQPLPAGPGAKPDCQSAERHEQRREHHPAAAGCLVGNHRPTLGRRRADLSARSLVPGVRRGMGSGGRIPPAQSRRGFLDRSRQ